MSSVTSMVGGALGSLAKVVGATSALAKKQEIANQKAQQVKQAKQIQQKTRRNFMRDYLSKQPTSLGGTVGDLPIDRQKQIAKTYDKNARRRMMNQMDREAKNK